MNHLAGTVARICLVLVVCASGPLLAETAVDLAGPLGADVTVETLGVSQAGQTIRPGDHMLTVQQGLVGPEQALETLTVRCNGRRGGIRLAGDADFPGTLRGNGNVQMFLDGATVNFSGRLEAADSGDTNTYFRLSGGSRLLFTADAAINQQMPNMIYARVIWTYGQGRDDIVEFAPKFRADRMGYPDIERWHADGFSVLFVGEVTLITHDSRSLPTVHKKAGSGGHTHHGVLSFTSGKQALWIVRSRPQQYDGVLDWAETVTMRTEKDFTQIGHYSEDSHCYFGTRTTEGGTFIKEGPAALNLLGTQAYSPGSRMLVREGVVRMFTNPASANEVFKRTVKRPENRWGPNLQIEVAPGAKLVVATPEHVGVGLASLRSEGTVDVRRGPVRVEGALTLGAKSLLEVELPSQPSETPLIAAGASARVNGRIRLRNDALRPGRYVLIEASEISGRPQIQAPDGVKATWDAGAILVGDRPAE